MDNEHPSDDLNQANSLIEVIEEVTVDDAILENFIQEEYDEEDYVDEVDIENNDMIIDQEFNLSQEIESQDQDYYTSDEMESSTDDQSLPDNSVVVDLIDDNDDDENTSNELSGLTISKIYGRSLRHIKYIQTPPNISMFPGYNITIFNELKYFIVNKTPNELVDPSKDCGNTTYEDLIRIFSPTNWLNDHIIQQYIQLLIQNCKKNDILSLGTYFFNDVAKHGFSKPLEKLLKNQKTRRNLLDYNTLLAPILKGGNHWALMVANINKRKIYLYDSFSTSYENFKDHLDVFISFLNKEYLEKMLRLSTADEHSWELNMGLSPVQENTYDCGVFVCTNARYHIFDLTINFTQEDLPLIRHRMTYELVLNTLLSTQ